MSAFFRKCTDYDSVTIGKALDYIEDNVKPKEYGHAGCNPHEASD